LKRQGRAQRKKFKGVLDTNVLVSAWFWEGNESKIVELVERGLLLGYTSAQMTDELRSALAHPKFQLSERDISIAMGYYELILRTIEPRIGVNAIHGDPSDNKILACAISVRADVIITGDRHLLTLGKFKDVKISTSAEFLGTVLRGR